MAVQWEMLGMIVRNVSAPSVTKSAVMAFRARWGFCLDSLFFKISAVGQRSLRGRLTTVE